MQWKTFSLAPLLSILGLSFAGISAAGVNGWTTHGPNGEPILALAIDPANTATIYAGTPDGVFKSTNRGGIWTAINNGLTITQVNALAIDPSTPAILYAGASSGNQGSVFKSVNGGASWTAINTGLISGGVQALAIDPLNPATLYAGNWGNGVYKSTDSGGTWAAANTGMLGPGFVSYVEALAINPAAPATLYAGTFGPRVFKSTDSAGTWSETGAGPNDPWGYGDCAALAIDPAAPATVYAGTDYGLFKSVDGGSSWTLANTGLTNTYVTAVAIDPSRTATIYAGTPGGGVFKSTDGGASWNSMNAGLNNLIVRALAIDPATPARIYAGTDGGVYEYLRVAGPLGFFTVAPCRVADTRAAPAPSGGPALGANTTRDFPVTGICGIPSTATAVAINLAVFQPSDDGDLRVYPAGQATPVASAINFRPGIIRASNAIVSLGAGQLSVRCDMPSGSTHFFLDVYGYFQ